jgi:hypothetical protein
MVELPIESVHEPAAALLEERAVESVLQPAAASGVAEDEGEVAQMDRFARAVHGGRMILRSLG